MKTNTALFRHISSPGCPLTWTKRTDVHILDLLNADIDARRDSVLGCAKAHLAGFGESALVAVDQGPEVGAAEVERVLVLLDGHEHGIFDFEPIVCHSAGLVVRFAQRDYLHAAFAVLELEADLKAFDVWFELETSRGES